MRSAFETAVMLRAAAPADLQAVSELGGRAFAEYDPHAARTTRHLVRSPGALTLLAERAERPIGFVIVRPQDRAVMAVDAIAVAESERGRGVGKRLMRAAEQRARTGGFRVLSLKTAQANVAALDLFLRLGFTITERAGLFYFGRQPACQLLKRLG